MRSSTRPWNAWTGSITDVCSSRSATCRQLNESESTIGLTRVRLKRPELRAGASGEAGAVHLVWRRPAGDHHDASWRHAGFVGRTPACSLERTLGSIQKVQLSENQWSDDLKQYGANVDLMTVQSRKAESSALSISRHCMDGGKHIADAHDGSGLYTKPPSQKMRFATEHDVNDR